MQKLLPLGFSKGTQRIIVQLRYLVSAEELQMMAYELLVFCGEKNMRIELPKGTYIVRRWLMWGNV